MQIVHLHDIDGKPTEAHVVFGQVVGVHIDPRYLIDGIFDLLAAQPVMRAGYRDDYVQANGLFKMVRPKA